MQQPVPEGDAPSSDDTGMPRFGQAPTDPQLTERECIGLGYPAGTEWMTFSDDELLRFVEYLFKRIGGCEVEMYAWSQVGSGWYGAYYFAMDRLDAIKAHRGTQWLDPIATRLRAYWDRVITSEKAGMAALEMAKDRAAVLFPDNPTAREDLAEMMARELIAVLPST